MSTATSAITAGFDVEKIREDFPVLKQKIHIRPFVTLRPLDRIRETFAELRARRGGMERVVLTPAVA